jgi:hypothetical protein
VSGSRATAMSTTWTQTRSQLSGATCGRRSPLPPPCRGFFLAQKSKILEMKAEFQMKIFIWNFFHLKLFYIWNFFHLKLFTFENAYKLIEIFLNWKLFHCILLDPRAYTIINKEKIGSYKYENKNYRHDQREEK